MTQPGLAAFALDWTAGLIGHHNAAFDAEEAGHYAGFDADEAEASFAAFVADVAGHHAGFDADEAEASFAAFVADKAGTFDEASVCDQRLDNGYADPAFDADEAADQNQTFDHAVFQMAKATR